MRESNEQKKCMKNTLSTYTLYSQQYLFTLCIIVSSCTIQCSIMWVKRRKAVLETMFLYVFENSIHVLVYFSFACIFGCVCTKLNRSQPSSKMLIRHNLLHTENLPLFSIHSVFFVLLLREINEYAYTGIYIRFTRKLCIYRLMREIILQAMR